MANSIDIHLGTAPEVYQLFTYVSANLALTDVISHSFNQSLQRDLFFGSWADAYIHDNGEYRIKISSPTHDLSVYETRIPQYLKAARKAMKIYNERVTHTDGFQFLMPFGLAMANVRSIQLFHFPPNETLFYSDYLYSPTNRRWECLLAQNGFAGRDNTLVERIIDVVPISAAGGASKAIAPYNNDFLPYGKMQLKTFLDGSDGITAPVVAYGGPVRDWLWKAYERQIKEQLPPHVDDDNPLQVLSLISLEIVKGIQTPLLCANHPSMYLYDTDKPVPPAGQEATASTRDGDYPAPLTVMRQDLIAAGWQAHMSADWNADPAEVLVQMTRRWSSDDKVEEIMRQQNTEFSYAK